MYCGYRTFLVVGALSSIGILTICKANDASLCPEVRDTYRMTSYRGRCFQFVFESRTWKSAKDYCSQNGGRLAKIDSAETWSFLQTTLGYMTWNTGHLWVGLNDMNNDDKWTWVGEYGEPEEPLTWGGGWLSGYPRDSYWYEFGSLKCALIRKQNRREWAWKNKNCNLRGDQYRSICEYAQIATSTASTVSDYLTTGVPSTTTRTYTTTDALITEKLTAKETKEEEITEFVSQKTPATTSKVDEGNDEYQPGVHTSVEKQHKDEETKHIPLYVVILAFVAGILVAVAVTVFLVCRRRKQRKEPRDTIRDEIYLTTTMKKETSDGNATALKRTISNDYVSDEDLEAAKSAMKNASEQSAESEPTENKFLASVRNPTLEGSLRRGKLPEVPTDGGYEIPVNLIGGTPTRISTPVASSPAADAKTSDTSVPENTAQENTEDADDALKPEGAQSLATEVYQVIPVDVDEEDIESDDVNKVYQSIV